MERTDKPFRLDLPEPSPAAIRLTQALAERLDAVAPRPFRVRADGGYLMLYYGTTWDSSCGISSVLDQEIDPSAAEGTRGSFAWSAASVAWNALSCVQDGIAIGTHKQWPTLPNGRMADCGSRTDGARIYLWYGPEHDREGGAVISFAPILLDDILHAR
jgi:hypothetical protein